MESCQPIKRLKEEEEEKKKKKKKTKKKKRRRRTGEARTWTAEIEFS
jgi:hypothetical protein